MLLDKNSYLGKKNFDVYKNRLPNLSDPELLKKKAKDLDENFFLSLESFKDSFFKYVSNPNYSENKKLYTRDKDNIIEYESSAFLLDNDIQKNLDLVHSLIKEQDKLNKITLNRNSKLLSKMNKLNSSDSSTEQMIDDKEIEYRLFYIKYYTFITGAIGILYYLFRAYRYRD